MEDSTLPLPSPDAIFAQILTTVRRPPCFLITNSAENASPSARLVGTFPISEDFSFSRGTPESPTSGAIDDDALHRGDKLVVTITSNAHTRKYQELKKNPYMTLAFHNPETVTQIVCRGKLEEMITDEKELESWWQERYKIMFTTKGVPPTQPDVFEHRLIILKFHILSIEVMSLATTIPIADAWFGWRPVIVSWQNGRWKVDRRNLRRYWIDERPKL
jgi:general stress protein 26